MGPKTELHGFSPKSNYTDRGTSACRRLRIEGVAWSAQRISTAVILGFLDPGRYFSIQVAPQLSSRGWVDHVPDPLFLRKSGSAGSRTRDLWICNQEFWPLDHRGDPPRDLAAEIKKEIGTFIIKLSLKKECHYHCTECPTRSEL
jgi:hypothetical protein